MVGAGRFERPTPCAQGIGCPHLGINRFNNLRTLLVGPCGNFSYNLDCKAAIRLVKPPTTPTGSPAGSADCEINQRGRAYVVTAGSLEGPSIAGFKLGDPPAFAAGGCRVEFRCGTGSHPVTPCPPHGSSMEEWPTTLEWSASVYTAASGRRNPVKIQIGLQDCTLATFR